MQVTIGPSKFNLIVNKNKTPIIDSKNSFKISNEFSLKELENIFLSIYVYEFIDAINIDINMLSQMNELPEEYLSKSNYKSFFHMDLFSFLFKAKKCDFLMKGTNGLSSNARICFTCDIIHKEKIKIKANDLRQKSNISKLTIKLNNFNSISALRNSLFGDFTLTTPPISMKELQLADIYLESNEEKSPYSYTTLNDLKHNIIKILGKVIIKQENDFFGENKGFNQSQASGAYSYSINQNNSNFLTQTAFGNGQGGINAPPSLDLKKNKFTSANEQASLTLENIPLITQTSCLYFTEIGHLYNSTFLHIINNDEELQTYRKNSKISWDYFYLNLQKIYDNLNNGNFDFNTLFDELSMLLRRSIDTEKFYFLYPDIESLNKMVILMMNIGLKIIQFIQISKKEEKIMILLKAINNLLKREEFDNAVINMCLSHTMQGQENTLKSINNYFYLKLFQLNEYCKQKKNQA